MTSVEIALQWYQSLSKTSKSIHLSVNTNSHVSVTAKIWEWLKSLAINKLIITVLSPTFRDCKHQMRLHEVDGYDALCTIRGVRQCEINLLFLWTSNLETLARLLLTAGRSLLHHRPPISDPYSIPKSLLVIDYSGEGVKDMLTIILFNLSLAIRGRRRRQTVLAVLSL